MIPSEGAPLRITDALKQKRDLPAGYPADGLVYPDTQPSEVRVETNGRAFVVFGTSDDRSQVIAQVEANLDANGWRIESRQTMPSVELFMCSKDGREQRVVVSEVVDDGGATTRMVAVTVDP